jgi:hypothetical protein
VFCFAVVAAVPWFVWFQPFEVLRLGIFAAIAAGVLTGLVCAPDAGADYQRLFRALDAILAAAGPIPLFFLLIPDEFQLEDELWRQVERPGYELDRPQVEIGSWLASHGVEALDLLPVFREVRAAPDGQRHLYHRRDTHWNRRGNATAGAALAEWLRDHL